MRPPGRQLSALLLVGATLAGCGQSADEKRASQLAQEALGLDPAHKVDKAVEEKVDVLVIEETRVVEKKTGRVLKTHTKETPVEIVRQKQIKTEVDVGDPKPGTGGPPPSAPR